MAADDDHGLDSTVCSHFGRCPFYTLVDIENDHMKFVQSVVNPFADDHGKPGQVPGFIHEQNADAIISGGMGQRSVGFFDEFGIEVVTGTAGKIDAVVDGFLYGTILGASPCKHESCH